MLELLDLKKKLAKPAYRKRMDHLQERLRTLQYEAQKAEVPIIICLEGWDCAGKGRVIAKLMEKLDPRLFRVHAPSAPSEEERRYQFLWRYQTKLPNDGHMVLFDHSWYGRVLVERCDKLTKKKIWRDAYTQINEFERWLTDDGQVLVKLWMHISKKEQAQRFKETLADPLLKWKITREYQRHHKDYDDWVEAVEEMLARTNSPHAPWSLVEANDLRWARVRVFETLVERIEEAVKRRQAHPAEVTRTAAARAALQAERDKRKAKDAERGEEERRTTEAKPARPAMLPKTEAAHA